MQLICIQTPVPTAHTKSVFASGRWLRTSPTHGLVLALKKRWRSVECGRAAGGLRVLEPYAEGVVLASGALLTTFICAADAYCCAFPNCSNLPEAALLGTTNRAFQRKRQDQLMLLLLIIVLVLLFGGGGGYRSYHYGYRDPLGGIAWLLVILLVIWLVAGGGLGHPVYVQ